MASPEPGIEARPQYIACATNEIKPLVKLVCEAAPNPCLARTVYPDLSRRNDCPVKKPLSICQIETHFRCSLNSSGTGGGAEHGFRRWFADVVNPDRVGVGDAGYQTNGVTLGQDFNLGLNGERPMQ